MKAQAMVAVIVSLSNLAVSILLTRRLGVIGVCLGSIITQLVIALPASSFIIRRLFRRVENVVVARQLRVDCESAAQ